MGDLISRAGAIKAICEDGTKLEQEGRYILLTASRKQRDADILSALPTVDAVPVVRCKDCKYSDGGTDEDGKLFFKCLGWVYGGTREDDFCSHGKRNERMDGDEHG